MTPKLIHNEESAGITSKSLRELRNALAKTIDSQTMILAVKTGEITCGFLVIDKTENTAYWSGDGFRTDGGGEGGRGFKSAEEMIEQTFRHFYLPAYEYGWYYSFDMTNSALIQQLRELAKQVIEEGEEWRITSALTPRY